jgi:cytidylate kinase
LTPVIAIDGPSASGKGTVAKAVAQALGWHYLDSGALYRLVALQAIDAGVSWDDTQGLAEVAGALDVQFDGDEIRLAGCRVTDAIRTEVVSIGASRCAAIPAVREALLDRQRAFREAPGLIAEGRDMGSVVFPDAALKVFLTASAEARAERRHKQLINKGIPANIQTLLRDLQERDARDAERPVAPLRQLPDARLLDTTRMTVEEAVARVLGWYRERAES